MDPLSSVLLVQQLAYMMLVQALRVHLAQSSQNIVGLALRAYGSAAQVRHRVHASQSSEPLDGEWSAAARRHVTLDLCP